MARPRLPDAECFSVTAIVVAGALLRWTGLNRVAIEHFDEGVYSSSLWYDGMFGQPWPSRELYAPPLLSTLIRVAGWIPGLERIAPFVPALIAGTLMPLLMWWMGRAWFGRAGGIAAAAIVAFSDFHILYSRMAMTDVPVLLFICGAVHLGISGISRKSMRGMAVAGFVCSLAMWTKYTGWLPLAVVAAGSGVWWLVEGRRTLGFGRLVLLLAAMFAVAFLCWSPWLFILASRGGYGAVFANHSGYLQGTHRWYRALIAQMVAQLDLDGFPARLSPFIAILAAGLGRWLAAAGSTWNRKQSREANSSATQSAPRSLLVRFTFAALSMTVMTFAVSSPLLLFCIAMGGLSGLFLWPVLERAYLRRLADDRSPTAPDAVALSEGDLRWAPTIDPALSAITVLIWFLALFAVTPTYFPYPRLMFPLLAAMWLAAAGGISWWLESNLSVARRSEAARRTVGSTFMRYAVQTSVLALTLSVGMNLIVRLKQDPRSVTWSPLSERRDSIAAVAGEIAAICRKDASGQTPQSVPELPSGTIIRPDQGALLPNGDVVTLPQAASWPDEPESSRPPAEPEIVIYAFGEPSLLFHLSQTGLTVAPVAHLNLFPPGGRESERPTYLVFGPYAKRSPGFWDDWLAVVPRYRHVDSLEFHPSEVVLMNLFSASWLKEHPESRTQLFEVYRVR